MIHSYRKSAVAFASTLALCGFAEGARVSAQEAKPLFRSISVPGNVDAHAQDINNRGAVIGFSSNVVFEPGVEPRSDGFLLLDQFLGQFAFPDAPFTRPFGINDRGDIVGEVLAPGGLPLTGFLFSKGRFTRLEGVVAEAINNHGDIAGSSRRGDSFDGFLRRDGAVSVFRAPGSVSTRVHGMNDRGQLVGEFDDASGRTRGFLLSRGRFVIIEVPGSVRTRAYDINNLGQVVGSFEHAGGKDGFVWRRGKFTSIVIPIFLVDVFGINDRGQIAGLVVDSSGTFGAFQSHIGRFLEDPDEPTAAPP
jgi:uncharacterized membrane protein